MGKLIIVCDDKTQKYANYLRQLISMNDDKDGEVVGVKDGEVDAVVWTEAQYKSNSPQLNSSQHVLFVGDNATAKAESVNIKYSYEKYGMRYGWLGKRGIIIVDSKNIDKKTYEEFLEYCKNIGQEFEKQEFKLFDKKKKEKQDDNKKEKKKNYEALKGAMMVVGAGVLFGIGGAVAGLGALGFKSMQINGKIREQQYCAIMTILYLQDLAKFMEN